MLLIDLKFECPDELLFTSIIFFSSFASNLLYLFCEPQWENKPPILDDNDFREGQEWDVP